MKIVKITKRNMEAALELDKELALFEKKFDKKSKVDDQRRRESRRTFKKKINDRNSLGLLVEQDGEYVAFLTGWIMRKNVWRTNIGYLCNLYVMPAYRRKGLARLLVKEFEKWLKSRKVRYVELSVYPGNNVAINAWSKMGFRPCMLDMIREI
jgi:ribosomal protein S18 acetylase RimI-like enzyme